MAYKDFEKRRETTRRRVQANPEKERERQRKYRKANPNRHRDWVKNNPEKLLAQQLKREYKISLDDYLSRLAAQEGVCAICCNFCSSGERLSVDHNHETGEFRGLLCRSCNLALGGFKDSPKLLQSAIDYLKGN